MALCVEETGVINMKIQETPQYGNFYKLLDTICRSAAELLHASASSIYLKEGDEVVMHAAYGYSDTLVHRARYKIGEGITGWIADGEGHEYMANSKEEILKHPAHQGKYDGEIWKDGDTDCYTLVAVPLLIRGDVYGLIKVENKCLNDQCCPFEKEDLDRLRVFLGALSDAIQQNKEIMAALGKYFVFVLMPFKEKFKNVYDCIKQASKKSDMFCARSDEEPIIGKISEKIYESIKKADIIVSVMTEQNANVFYETGYAHATDKPTIHIAENPKEIPFDLIDYNHVVYREIDMPALRDELFRYFEFVKNNMLNRSRVKRRITNKAN